MSTPISNYPNRYSDSTNSIEIITNDFRRDCIIDFIKIHQGCSINNVIRDAEKNEYASKKTVQRIIIDLIKNKIVKKQRDRKNSRNCTLFIEMDNPLVVIPDRLKELENLFKDFTNELVKIYSKSHNEWPNQKHFTMPDNGVIVSQTTTPSGEIIYALQYSSPPILSSTFSLPYSSPLYFIHSLQEERLTINEVIQIAFVIIDIIYAPIKYLQRTTWINYEQDTYYFLYNKVFLKIDNLNKIALDVVKSIYRDPYKYNSNYENDDYFVTVENLYQQYTVLEKICLLRHRCKSIGLSDKIEAIFDYLIENNMDYFTLLDHHISPKFKWPNLQPPKKSKLDIIHDSSCPIKKSSNDDQKCSLSDNDPTFSDF